MRVVPAVDYCHFVRNRVTGDVDEVVERQSLQGHPHDTAPALWLDVGQHEPCLPYWQLLIRRRVVASICCGDFETIFLLVSPLDAEMPLSRHVRRSSGTCKRSKMKEGRWANIVFLDSLWYWKLGVKRDQKPRSKTYLFKSNVDSSWKTCARENTVLVFFFLFCIDPLPPGEVLPSPRSGLQFPSSSIISPISSSESHSPPPRCEYAGCGGGVFDGCDDGGLKDGDKLFSVLFVELVSVSAINKQTNKYISNSKKENGTQNINHKNIKA